MPDRTPNDLLKANLNASAGCKACDRVVVLELPELAAAGLGDCRLLYLQLRCGCGGMDHAISVYAPQEPNC